ncbi:MAG: DUF1178 family protein [Pseudomonadota bacterium]
MIKYKLRCASGCEFEGWFRSSADYDEQAEAGLLSCGVCGCGEVSKAVMAPAVARRDRGAGNPITMGPEQMRSEKMREVMAEAAKKARAYVQANFENVGDKFAEEARRIHYGETGERKIYGEATGSEVRDLIEEGVPIAPLPGAEKTDRAGVPQAKATVEHAPTPALEHQAKPNPGARPPSATGGEKTPMAPAQNMGPGQNIGQEQKLAPGRKLETSQKARSAEATKAGVSESRKSSRQSTDDAGSSSPGAGAKGGSPTRLKRS